MADIFRPFDTKTPTLEILDRVGKPVRVGAAVYILGKLDTIWSVLEITPVMDPTLPPGMLKLTLTATQTSIVPANKPLPDGLLVLTAEEQQERLRQLGIKIPGPGDSVQES